MIGFSRRPAAILRPLTSVTLNTCRQHARTPPQQLTLSKGEGHGLHEELSNAEGNVDIAKVLALCPSWEQAIKDGMPCIVFKRELEAACPELPAFLSEAGNSKALVVSPPLPSSVMPVQKLEQVAKKRQAAATGRMQQTANKKKKP